MDNLQTRTALVHKIIRKYFFFIALIIALGLYLHDKRQNYNNPHPLQPIKTKTYYVWPKGCTEDALKRSQRHKGGGKIPCACADPKYEIQDWYERGLSPWGNDRNKIKYYRIGSAAVGIVKRKSLQNTFICDNESRDAFGYDEFFVSDVSG